MSDPNHMGIVQKNAGWVDSYTDPQVCTLSEESAIQSFAISTFNGAETALRAK